MHTTAVALAIVVLLLAGCATAPSRIANRTVDHGSVWLVRLDHQPDAIDMARGPFSHPFDVSDAELASILRGVRVSDEAGGVETPALSEGELICIVPGVREALHRAMPAEWIVFAVINPKMAHQTFTSGAMFAKEGKLHIMIANYKHWLQTGVREVVDPVKAAPLQARASGVGALTFDPPQFMAPAGIDALPIRSDKPVARLVVDYAALRDASAKSAAKPRAVGSEAHTLHVVTGC